MGNPHGMMLYMHIPTHLLSGWCIANLFPLGPRERLFAMAAATLPDLDGITYIAGEEWYWRTHHILAHNLPFGVLLSGVLTLFSRHRLIAFPLYLALFHLHLVMDYFGSGEGWTMAYFWPFSQHEFGSALAWPLMSWQNYLAFVLLLLWTVLIARTRRRTPLELLAPRFEARLCPQA